MTALAPPHPHADPTGLWRTAQALGLLLTVTLLAGLLLRPALSLNILWNAVVPVLPAVFLVSPALWRNVCPLATLTMLPGGRAGDRTLPARWNRAVVVAGIVLLVLLVPARRVLFNTDGTALAVTITAVALVALAGGLGFRRKAGFCNGICPVLPVERLYGQRPLLAVRNVRCNPCIRCTEHGCLDSAPADSLPAAVGPAWTSGRWLTTPYGVFAAAFPGFVAGYYTIANGPLGQAGAVYLRVAVAAAISYGVVALLVRALRPSAATALVGLAALAIGIYYWFAASTITAAWGAATGWAWAIRGAALALIAAWLWRGPGMPAPAATPGAAGLVGLRSAA